MPAARRNSRRCIAAGVASASWSEQPPQSAGAREEVSFVILIGIPADTLAGPRMRSLAGDCALELGQPFIVSGIVIDCRRT